ncbi:MAG: dihydropteroate synthase [Comamonadaceae bacterium]|nr:MAG: dihydropteroate synthase [Comamonadaceae bacterium]
MQIWQTSRFRLALDRPLVMGIVNVTPDSFSDGGRHFASARSAVAHCEALVADGAHILDIGGESTRPGIAPVSLEDERARVLPVLREAVRLGVPVSLDTYKSELMREALDLGVDIINDIWALRQPGAEAAVAAHPDCGVCIMHMQNNPEDMQIAPHYENVVGEVADFLRAAITRLQERGVSHHRICIDPGFGFGKNLEHNVALFRNLEFLREHLDMPVLVGMSRKSMIGQLTGKPVQERLAGSVAAALCAAAHGADIVRVHDVAATVDALKVWRALS